MEGQKPNYRREFVKSPHHLWFALLTAGVGFLLAQPLFLLIGATAYALGWIYLPDLDFFHRWVDRRHQKAKEAAAQAQVADFLKRRDILLASLSHLRRGRYDELADVCRSIESASQDAGVINPDTPDDLRLRKLDELMWTFLRLLGIEESLERFLEIERREGVPDLVAEAESEITELKARIESAEGKGNAALEEQNERLLSSRTERLEVLRKRLQRIDQARANLALVVAEQERLDQQIKLIRADAVATRNTATLSARITATVENLDQTNKWLSEMDQFKDVVGDMPDTDIRVGFEPSRPPVLRPVQEQPAARRQPTPTRQGTRT